MTASIGTGRIHDRGLDLKPTCEICGIKRSQGSHIKCAKKRAEIYRNKGRKDA